MLDEHVVPYLDAKFMSTAPTETDITMRKEQRYLQYSYEPWSAHHSLEMVFDTLLQHYERRMETCLLYKLYLVLMCDDI